MVCDERSANDESLEKAFQITRPMEHSQDEQVIVLEAVEDQVFGERGDFLEFAAPRTSLLYSVARLISDPIFLRTTRPVH